MMQSIRQDWFSNVRNDVLPGLVVALALIPEAIGFSIIAHVDPKVGLYASFSIATIIAFAGGRPAMISAATGSMALVMVTLVRDHGLQYMLAATVLTGIFQIIIGWLRLAELMRFVSRSVITGFVNALAVLIFMAQLPQFLDKGWQVYAIAAASLGIIYLLPRLTRAVPSPLVAIVAMTGLSMWLGLDVGTVGDMGKLPDSLPVFLLPDIPLNWETLRILVPVSVTLAAVGLLETMMTASIVDEYTDTTSHRHRECMGQGLANIVTGFLGGMGGCAMIGQSVINVKSGGRGRLSTLVAGIMLLVFVVFLNDWVGRIPMAALSAVMIMVSIGTFDWSSFRNLRRHPGGASVVMLATMGVTIATNDLSRGVLVGVLLSGLFFAHKVGKILRIESQLDEPAQIRTYTVVGQVFFASAERFVQSFDYQEKIARVRLDLHHAHFWDITAVGAVDKVVNKFHANGIEIEVTGINTASATLIEKFAEHDRQRILGDLAPQQHQGIATSA